MIPCKVCGRKHTPGVGGAAKEMCSRCYKRDARDLPPIQDAPAPRAKKGEAKLYHPVRLEAAQLAAVKKAAGKIGIGPWIREAVAQRLEREARQ